MKLPKILAIILAGGKGSRLDALTEDRAKPALPIGGTYRLIDISLSNLAHSHISDVLLAVQYLPYSINRHLDGGRPWDLDRSHGGLKLAFPFEGDLGEGFADGNSATLFSQLTKIEEFDPDYVLVLSADHLYLTNYLDVLDTHRALNADLTMVTTEVKENPSRYSVIKAEDQLVTDFEYKPDEPKSQTVACEVFLFNAKLLVKALRELEATTSLADYGDDLLPYFVKNYRVAEHRHNGYWLDLGTIQSYWTAHMQILEDDGIRLDDAEWPIWSAQPQLIPARIYSGSKLDNSLVAPGSHIHGTVINSVVGPRVTIEEGATVTNCVILDGSVIRSGADIRNAVVDFDAEVSGVQRGTDDAITLIGSDGKIKAREAFDKTALLPRWLRENDDQS